ncbi:hypothetical protein [Paenibacillus ferrarius]|uniref:hypothetical protein n=1 Tax=Paenibacillus ferrarius TaxID=1469647 RepID=UPI003D28BFB8
MKWTMRIVLTIGISTAMALGLSLLSNMELNTESSSPYTWSSHRGGQLTDKNLADMLVQVPLQMRIRRVELSMSRLSLDLSLPKNADTVTVYRDLYTLSQAMLNQTKNVDQVFVRVMDYSGGSDTASSQLVLAMVAQREFGKDMEKRAGDLSLIQLEQELQNRFRITYTSKWQQKYPL